jgi:acyl transferase domain-containing protein
MNPQTVFVFSGQGSQYHGMARQLFERDSSFRDQLTKLDDCARRLTGESVIGSFLDVDPGVAFTRLRHTHPAVFLVEVALARRFLQARIQPTWVLGASLGEFAALVTAGVLSAEDALRIVIGHAEAVERHCPPGGMLAVLDAPELFQHERDLFEGTWLAAIHFRRHFVVSGSPESLQVVEKRLKDRSVVHQRLPVEYAFHSPLVNAADETLASLASSVVWRRPRCGIMSCAEGGALLEPSPRRAYGVTAKMIQFERTVQRLEAEGPWTYVDLGPAGTIATFLKYVLPRSSGSRIYRVLSQHGNETGNLDRALRAVGPVPTNAVGDRSARFAS